MQFWITLTFALLLGKLLSDAMCHVRQKVSHRCGFWPDCVDHKVHDIWLQCL